MQDHNLKPFAAALVSMAGLGGPSDAQYILQLPPESTSSEEWQQDALQAAIKLYNTPDDMNRVVVVNAMESLREARTQCAVCPGALLRVVCCSTVQKNTNWGFMWPRLPSPPPRACTRA